MTLKIYQLPIENDRIYMPYEEGKVNLEDYKLVYEGETDEWNLDEIYYKFQFPVTGFKGHSLSMSDIIELNGTKHYVDTFGFVKLT